MNLEEQLAQAGQAFGVPQENIVNEPSQNAGVLSNTQMGLPKKKNTIGLAKKDVDTIRKRFFMAGEFVNAKVLDAIINSYGKIVLNLLINNTEHAGSEYKLSIKVVDAKGPQLERAYDFLKAFYSDEEIENGTCDVELLIGQTISFKALATRDWNGQTFQDFENFKKM